MVTDDPGLALARVNARREGDFATPFFFSQSFSACLICSDSEMPSAAFTAFNPSA